MSIGNSQAVVHVLFSYGEHRVVVNGGLQRPIFNSRGAAITFGDAVNRGVRKAEPLIVKEGKKNK